MANLFDKSKEQGVAKPTKKNDKEVVEINDKVIHAKLSRLAEINAEIDSLTAESTMIGSEIIQRAIKEYNMLYNQTSRNPGSFIIKAIAKGLKSASLMFIPSDKYMKIDAQRSIELQNKYNDITTEKTTYIMDTTLIAKYGEIISDLITKCKKIEKSDKERLISAQTTYEIKKGTINDLKVKFGYVPTEEILDDIKPVYAMKNIKVDEE